MPTRSAAARCRKIGNGGRRFAGLRGRVRRRLSLGEEAGQSLVEFALTLPLLLLVVTGLMTFGIAINNYLLLTDATNVGARQLAINRGATDPCSVASSAVEAAAPLLKYTGSATGLTFKTTVGGTVYSGITCTGAATYLTAGSTITLQVVYPCSLRFYNYNNFTTCYMTAQTAELVQ